MTDEIELKYAVKNEAAYARWTQVQQMAAAYVAVPAAAPQVEVVDTYLDTPDFRFLRHGFALRQRREGARILLTIKSLSAAPEAVLTGSLHRRREVEALLSTPEEAYTPASWPVGILALAEPILAHGQKLEAVAIVRQTRHKRIVTRNPEGSPPLEDGLTDTGPLRAELSVDRVEIVAPRDMRTVAQRFELELELLRGDEEELRAVAQWLIEEPDIAPQAISKFEDAVNTLARYTPGLPTDRQTGAEPVALDITPTMHMAEAARLILHQQMMAMALNEPGVRYSDDPEFIHDMRVATRRARVALDVFGPYLKAKHVEFFRKRLRKTGRLLGAVRDLDVALLNVDASRAAREAEEPTLPPQKNSIQKQWRKERSAAFATLLEWLDGPKYSEFLQRLSLFVNAPGKGVRTTTHVPGQRPTAQQVRHVAPPLLMAQFAAVRSYETLFNGGAPVDYATVHRLRIDAKYLRYELEFLRHLLGRSGEALIKQLKKLQEHLGQLNDAVVATAMLETATDDGDESGHARRHLEERQEIVRALSAQTPIVLADFCKDKNRRHLGRALALL